MGRRAKKHEHVNHERWLVSYADFITLLFAFFVVMFAVSQVDSKKLGRFVESVNVAFQLSGVFRHTDGSPLARGGGGNSIVAPIVAERPSLLSEVAPPGRAAEIHEAFAAELERAGLTPAVSVRHDPRGVALLLSESIFGTGTADLTRESHKVLYKVAALLDAESGPIQVEVHADEHLPPGAAFASSWEFCAARAAKLAHFLAERGGVLPQRLFAIGLVGRPHAPGEELDQTPVIELVLITALQD